MAQPTGDDPALESLLASLRSTLAEIRSTNAAAASEYAAYRAAEAPRDAERVAQARRGALGPQWQQLQQRIDLGQTSLDGIFSGQDESAEAQAVRVRTSERGDLLRPQLELYLATEDTPDPVFEENRAATASLQATAARLQALNDELRRA